jgi:hypothetical protein
MKIKARYNPVLLRLPDGRVFACAGEWHPLPSHVASYAEMMEHVEIVRHSEPVSAPDAPQASWEVQGSKGSLYTVRRSHRGAWSCTCPGYGWRGKCKHIGRQQNESG